MLTGVIREFPCHKFPDVGLRRTCAYYRTSARAMCVRKCVRKGFETVRAEVSANGQLSMCDLRSHFSVFFTSLLLNMYLKDATFNLFLHTYILLSIILDLPALMSHTFRRRRRRALYSQSSTLLSMHMYSAVHHSSLLYTII